MLIQARNLCKDFPSGEGTTRVLRNLNLNVYEGEFVILLGESGCGKSTLVNILAGMDSLTEGSLTIGDKDFTHPSDSMLTSFRRHHRGHLRCDPLCRIPENPRPEAVRHVLTREHSSSIR